jgi:hypothetical protein
MSVIPMSTRLPRSGQSPHTDRLQLPHHHGARRSLRSLLGLPEVHHDYDSPGRDVERKYPTIPDDIFRSVVQDAVVRETLFDAGLQPEDQILINQEYNQ